MEFLKKLCGVVCLSGCALINTQASAQQALVYEITSQDGKLTPSRIEVPAERKIKLVLINAGKGALEFEHPDLHIEKVLAPGARSFVVIHKLRAGRYRFIDEYHPNTAYCEIIAK